jgi:hypothetical protein
MIRSARPVLSEDMCVVQKKGLFNNMLYVVCVKRTLDERPSIFIRDKPIFSSERLLHKDFFLKGSVKNIIFAREPQGA